MLAVYPDIEPSDIGLTAQFDAALEGRYVRATPSCWSAFTHEDFTLRALNGFLRPVLIVSARHGYSRHLDEMEFFCRRRMGADADLRAVAHYQRKLAEVEKMRANFLARIAV